MKRILIGTIVGLVALLSSNSWAEKGDQKIRINSADIGATVTVKVVGTPSIRYLDKNLDSVSSAQSGNWTVSITGTPSIRYLDKTSDSVSAAQSGAWTVSVSGTPSIRYLNQISDSVRVFGDQGVAIKQDSTGQIYAITAPESGVDISMSLAFSNIATGSWVEVGSYTVTTGKSLKIYNVHATGDTYLDFKIFTGVVGQELYLAVSPSYVADELNRTRPKAIPPLTIVRIYAKAIDAINGGTISFGGFEY